MKGMGRSVDYQKHGRQDRMIRERIHDPYQSTLKIKESTVCPECKAVVQNGRWTWAEVPIGASMQTCPACLRIRDRVPAGYLTLKGEFLALHEEEIMNLVHNHEEQERAMHPLKRIMDIEKLDDSRVITFTDAHLARSVGEVIHKAYDGELDYQYTKDDVMLRVNWSR